MNKTRCPRCQSMFYSSAREPEQPCPYCGFVSKSFESDRRISNRIAAQKGCDIKKGELKVPVKTVDLSDTGLGIKFMGHLPFLKDDTVDVVIEELEIEKKAKVVWTRNFYGVSRAGLRFLDRTNLPS